MAEHPNQPAPSPAPGRHDKAVDETFKETFESIVIAFVLAFVFRAYVVEAFVIPTGSMAPTLLGAHVPVTCGACNYSFKLGADVSSASTRALPSGPAYCPMCGNVIPLPATASAGDRILVQKYLYSILEPKRWDVVVFKAPHEPETNYIKRLVGLPQEQLQIIEGNVYVQPLDARDRPTGEWHIARKTDPAVNLHAYKIQRTVWQPIYHSSYVPMDARLRGWRPPWNADRGDWSGLGGGSEPLRRYQHTDADVGRLTFDFGRALPMPPGLHAYNQTRPRGLTPDPNPDIPFEDVRIAAGFQPSTGELSVDLQTTGRIDETNEPVTLIGRIEANGTASLGRLNRNGEFEAMNDATNVGAFEPGVTRDIELWFVDQELSLWIDGKLALRQRFEIDIQAVRDRPTLEARPEVAITVSGCPVTLHRVEVDRDLYYIAHRSNERAVLVKQGVARNDKGPVTLHADQFLCLGDNSPASHDGRSWTSVNDWVAAGKFTTDGAPGIVPRRLVMGRAFFVYYPAPYGWTPRGTKIIPNFGDMRFIH